jgi:pimeloyl-ACP methyl ester carboxylesterase
MKRTKSPFLKVASTVAAGAGILAWASYRKDVREAIRRVETGRRFVDTAQGRIEFAESGNGPAVLVIHGAGGGFDQGLDLGRSFLGENFRIIAPSRFGYLGTPLSDDASAEAQADAHLELLDALKLDRVAVIGVSAGGPSALQLCLRHPDRCSALVLAVAMAYTPEHPFEPSRSRWVGAAVNAILSSDLVFWAAMKLAPSALIPTILGTPIDVYRNATAEERRIVDATLRNILPVSRRAAGLLNEGEVAAHLTQPDFENFRVPALIITAADDGYRTYESSIYTATQIHQAKLIAFSSGGHLLVGHEAAVRAEVNEFLTAANAGAFAAVAS